MKKIFLVPSLLLFALSGCVTSAPQSSNITQKINLTKDNYSTYIVVVTNTSYQSSGGWTNTIYQYSLVGSSGCRFYDCIITYGFAKANGQISDTQYTMALTISGNGESKRAVCTDRYYAQDTNYYVFTVLSATGTVEILN